MTNKQQIIQDAIEGGWNQRSNPMTMRGFSIITHEPMFLDPLFWQAVGKTRGWSPDLGDWRRGKNFSNWKDYWHQFIDHLAEGDDYETALSKLV